MSSIVQKENSVLRKIARELKPDEISSPKTKRLIEKTKRVLELEPDGVGLAAPQIGEPVQIFIISKKILPYLGANVPLVYINPRLLRRSAKKKVYDEGCLSVRGIYGKIKRSEKVTIEAWGEGGQKFSRGGSGLLAQIYQHEIDHLNGVLFTDNATSLHKIAPKNHAQND